MIKHPHKKKWGQNFIEDQNIINKDIMKLDLNKFNGYNKIVGNLPYYITTPIIFKTLEYPHWDKIVFMVQKEVAERIIASPGNKVYGRLSVMVQVLANVTKKFNVSKNIFYPKPKVDSSIIELTIKKNIALNDLHKFSNIVRIAFGQRRKMLRNSLKNHLPINTYDKYKNKRPEELRVEDYIEISNNI